MTQEAIQCAKCGAKFSAARDRCPRCRAYVAVEDPAANAARSARLRTATIAFSAIFVLGLGALWLSTRSWSSSPESSVQSVRKPALPAALPAADNAEPAFVQFVRWPAQAQSELEQSAAYFEKAVNERPGDADARKNLGQAQLQLGQTRQAVATLQALTDGTPGRAESWLLLAHAQCSLSRWDECITSLRKAGELATDDPLIPYNLGVALHRRGSDPAAIAEYKRALTLRPSDAPTQLGLAVSYDRAGQTAEAIVAYQEYLRLLPDASGADKIRARIATLGEGSPGR
jgi:Flp pilus assembly protein TadD